MAFTGRADILKQLARGKGLKTAFIADDTGTTTAAAATSGLFTTRPLFNDIGTTYASTRQTVPLNGGTAPLRLLHATGANNTSTSATLWLCRLYTIGTMNLNATGNQFTHHAATFPVLRTQFGEASSPVNLIPIIQVTTATTTTAAVISLSNVAGTDGYVDQDGNTVVGTASSFTFPAAATAVHSAFIPFLEITDYAIRDIVNIRVHTAAAAGAARIFGAELLSPINNWAGGGTSVNDHVFGALSMQDLQPAVATSGTAESVLCVLRFGQTGTSSFIGEINAVLDN